MEIEYEYKTTVAERLKSFGKSYGSIEVLRKRVGRAKKVTKEFADLEEWDHYLTPHEHEHPPSEDIRFSETVIFRDPKDFFAHITPERLRLLEELRGTKEYQSLRELALGLHRDPKNVYEDLKALEAIHVVTIDRRNARRSIPRAHVNRVLISI